VDDKNDDEMNTGEVVFCDFKILCMW